jgi:hypothetical protein
MENDEKSGVKRRWRTLEEEIEALRTNPVAQSLLRSVAELDPNRAAVFMAALPTLAGNMEGTDNGES